MADAIIFQILGLAYSAIGLGMLANPRFYEAMIKKMIVDEAVLFLTGLLVLAIGCLLVVYHNIWTGGWTMIITIFGWLAQKKLNTLLSLSQFFRGRIQRKGVRTPLR